MSCVQCGRLKVEVKAKVNEVRYAARGLRPGYTGRLTNRALALRARLDEARERLSAHLATHENDAADG